MPHPATLWRTLRHLRPRQAAWQLLHRLLPPRNPAPLAWGGREVTVRVTRERNTGRVYFDGASGFNFNNEVRTFAGWSDPGARRLWLYNLNAMAWLFDCAGDEEREAWIRKWIRENPPHQGGVGWEPYPLSLRLFYWSKYYAHARARGVTPDPEERESLGRQSARLLANLEFHLDGNHLLENLLALVHAGFYWDDSARSHRARRRVQRLLTDALAEQYLPDGGHYELSPMYHAILLERVLDLLNAWPEGGTEPFPGLRATLTTVALKGLDWLEAMSVGGRFALFNDAAYDTAPEAGRLLEFGTILLGRPPLAAMPLMSMPPSGYYRAEAGGFTVIFDAGPLGPDRQMGHAQGDLLSFCLWLGEAPILVHPGNYEYLSGGMRDYCRSTAAHNTFVPDGAEQAEWWAAHRVGWRARPRDVRAIVDAASGEIRLRGAHDGFTRLPGKPVHARELVLTETSLLVRDSLSADPGRPSRAFFHVHPDCIVERGGNAVVLTAPGGALRLESAAALSVEDSWYCPEFGVKRRNKVVVATANSGVSCEVVIRTA